MKNLPSPTRLRLKNAVATVAIFVGSFGLPLAAEPGAEQAAVRPSELITPGMRWDVEVMQAVPNQSEEKLIRREKHHQGDGFRKVEIKPAEGVSTIIFAFEDAVLEYQQSKNESGEDVFEASIDAPSATLVSPQPLGELHWIKKGVYRGDEKRGGILCAVYESTIPSHQISGEDPSEQDQMVAVTVYIDSDSGLPAVFEHGPFVRRYQFHQDSQEQPELPDLVQKTITEFRQALQRVRDRYAVPQ